MASFDNPTTNPYAAPTSAIGTTDALDLSNYVGYATFSQRFAAVFLDAIIVGVINFALGMVVGTLLGTAGASKSAIVIAAYAINLVVFLVYYVGMISSSSQATLGKMALGLKVTDLQGRRIGYFRALGRELGKFISAITLLIGYLMANFTAKKQALHDMMAGTLVLKVR